ncbi:MAG: PAS domain S-box protein [Methanomicrobiaceae archaeon]|uniref:histidine kinase n=1 Tax=hydrocarbon metagenome TaxID=938273 RepID=A0A0W8FIG8_9ZZZZ|nr:PAS domain S-box protein [Methanomicrobiaceae archaeon]MDD5418758.1 PAS domain S-box protein [Methanomicrobiaceae archaeon]
MISVLLVDDDSDLLDIARIFLERDGCLRADTCTSAQQALSMLKAEKYDAIVSDYEMPGMNGIEFLKAFRSEEDTTPFIIFTGRGREHVVIEALNFGADFYLQKGGDPISQFAELKHMIQQAVGRKRAEDALRESERVLSTLLRNLPGMAYRCRYSPDWTMEFVSEGAADLTGYAPADLVGDRAIPYADLIRPGDREAVWDAICAGLQEKGAFQVTYRITTAAGEEKWVWEQGVGVPGSGGAITALEGFITDITERRLAEEALRESEEKYRVLVENALDGIIIQDFNGIILMANSAAASMSEVEDWREMIGKSSLEFIAPEFHNAVITDLKNVYQERGGYLNTYRGISAQGRERWIEGLGTRITYQGRPANLVVVRDVTSRIQAELALERSESRFSTVFEQSPLGMVITDLNQRILMVNGRFCRMLGYTEPELFALTMPEITHREDLEASMPEMAGLASGEIPVYKREKRYIRKDRGILWASLTVSALHDGDGKARYLLGMVEDISDRKQAEETLRQAGIKLHLMNSITRHDIINQLTVVSGNLALARELAADPDQISFLDKLKGAADAIHRQIEFMRDYQDAGVRSPEWQNVGETFSRSIASLDTSGVSLSLDLDGISVYADPMLEKVFYNLVDNSIRHGNGVSEIRISARCSEAGCMLLYEDDGQGIPAREKALIFNRGFGKHSGYGLFLIRHILDITGMTIQETGEPVRGVRFEIRVPSGCHKHLP